MKKIFFIILIIVISFVFILPQKKVGYGNVSNDFYSIKIKLAVSEKEKSIGLSGLEKIKDFEGMLFVFKDASYDKFWMKGMLFDIDIVWIDKNGYILKIDKNVSKASYDSKEPLKSGFFYSPIPYNFVLEIPANMSDYYKIVEGQKLIIKY